MNNFMVALFILAFMVCSTLAFAGDSTCDCNCKSGGLGIKISKFVAGFGVKSYNTIQGCENNIGLGIMLGSELHAVIIGFGFNKGVIGLGFTLRGPETTTGLGLGFGWDYSDCRMVWPIEE